MVALRGTDIVRVPLAAATGELKTVPPARYAEAAGLLRLRPASAGERDSPAGREPVASGRSAVRWRRGRPDRAGRTCPPRSSPTGPTPAALAAAVADAAALPPLVFAGECDHLTRPARPRSRAARRSCCRAATAPRRSRASTADAIRAKLKTLLQMAVVLTYAAAVPVVKVGRIAGQYAQAAQLRDTRPATASSCRPTAATRSTASRSPPRRASRTRGGWSRRTTRAAATLNLVRAFTQGGYADLRQVHAWNQDFVREPARGRALRAAGRRDRPRAGVHARLRRRPGGVPAASSSTPATRRCCSTTSAR